MKERSEKNSQSYAIYQKMKESLRHMKMVKSVRIPRITMSSTDERLKILIEKNTFYIKKSPEIEKEYQELIALTVETLQRLKEKVKGIDASKDDDKRKLRQILAIFLQKEKYGIEALLTLCGLSDEKLYRAISFLRIEHQNGIYESSSAWVKEEFTSEWKMDRIKNRLADDPVFANDIAMLLLGENPLIAKMFTSFDLRKLNAAKFLLAEPEIFDTLARYRHFGSYNATGGKSPEQIIKDILDELNINHTSGEVKGIRRKMDVVIPSKERPKILIQCSYVGTTSSGMGDKAKTERDVVAADIKKHYPHANFILFVDGIGWLVRASDLEKMVEAGDYVFTFHEDQLKEFRRLLQKLLSEEDYKDNLGRFF